MSQRSKGIRPDYEAAEFNRKTGKLERHACVVIRDGKIKKRTGIPATEPLDSPRVTQAIADYIAKKQATEHAEGPRERDRRANQILILDALNQYFDDKIKPRGMSPARLKEAAGRIETLSKWWCEPGRSTLDDIHGRNCRAYVAWRAGKPWKSCDPEKTGNAPRIIGTAAGRRELEDLRAAVNHQIREGYCREVVKVALPEKSQPRERVLTRTEAARLLLAAWRARQMMHGNETERAVGKHVARFILIGLYTGTRHRAICNASVVPNVDGRGFVDLPRGMFFRHATGERKTKKRQPPVRLTPRLLAHLRRWGRLGIAQHAVIEWNGKPVKSVRKAFTAAVVSAGLDPKVVTPHILRHTAATWMVQRGVKLERAAEYLGMTEEVLRTTYYHESPDYQADTVAAIGGR